MQLAKSNGYGTDGFGVRRLIFAGQPVPPGLYDIVMEGEDGTVDSGPVITGPSMAGSPVPDGADPADYGYRGLDEKGNVVAGPMNEQHTTEAIEERARKAGEAAKAEAARIQGTTPSPDAPADDGVLKGQALQDRAEELEIEGRSSMKADELRDAIAQKEAELEAGGQQ